MDAMEYGDGRRAEWRGRDREDGALNEGPIRCPKT